MRKTAIILPAAAALAAAPVQAQDAGPLAFVACPILRDTATVPCWLAEFDDRLYFLTVQEGTQAAVYPPSLGHLALIEGAPTGEMRCGGEVLIDLHISILPEPEPACPDTILPASDRFQPGEIRRGPGPAGEPEAGLPPPPNRLQPEGSRTFEIYYDFDWQTAGREAETIQEAAAYAKAYPDAQINVLGYRGAVALSDGRVIAEAEDIGDRRSHELLETLAALGVDRDKIMRAGETAPDLGDYTARRAIIAVVLGGSPEPESEF